MQDLRQRAVERAKQLRGLSYRLIAMRGREAATAVEYCETRPSCEGQVVCVGGSTEEVGQRVERQGSGRTTRKAA